MSAWPSLAKTESLISAETAARDARRAAGLLNGALSVQRACAAAMVQISRRQLQVGERRHTAMLVPAADGFRVVVDPQLWQRAAHEDIARQRLRFVVAHELGHTLFYRPGSPPRRTRPADAVEERFCHRFATSLLVPPEAASEAVLDAAGLYGLARHHDVSLRVAAWAIARARRDVTILWLSHRPHPRRGDHPAMRVQWGASQRFVAHGESFKCSLAELAVGEQATVVERFSLSGRDEHMEVSAWRFARAMLAFVRPAVATDSGRPTPSQLALF